MFLLIYFVVVAVRTSLVMPYHWQSTTMLPRNEASPPIRHDFNSNSEANEYVQLFLSDMCFWEQTRDESPRLNKRGQEQETKRKYSKLWKGKREELSSSEPILTVRDLRWKAAVDPVTGKTYYYNTFSRKTQWDKVSRFYHIAPG